MSNREEKRHRRLLRLLRAVQQMKRMEEMQAQALEERITALRRRRHALLSAIGTGALTGERLGQQLRDGLYALARAEEQARKECRQQKEALRQRHLQEKQMQRLQQHSGRALRTRAQRDALLEVAELAASRRLRS